MTRNKFSARAVEIDGIRFDSQAEATRYGQLKLLQRAGQIKALACHPEYSLRASNGATVCKYEADFEYFESGRFIAEDVKGVATPIFRLKLKWFRECFPDIELRILDAKGRVKLVRTRKPAARKAA